MTDINLKTETPDTTLPATGFLFGADSQASASPSVYSVPVAAAALLSNAPNGSAAAPSFAMGTTGLYTRAVTARLNFTINGFDTGVEIGSTIIALQNTSSLAWVSGLLPSTSPDLYLTRRGIANLRLGTADTVSSSTVTITIATPGVVTWNGHGLSTGTPVFFTTTGALPTGITASTTYYVIAVDANTFRIATSVANAFAGTAINTSGSQSGTQTGTRGAISQTLSVQSAAGTTNFPGADLLITGSQGTGSGAGGSLIFQVAPAASSGSAQNALQNVFLLPGASGEARLVNSAGGSADFKICSTSNTNVHLTIKHGTDASGASGTTTGFIGRISSSFGFFDGGGSLIFGQPSGSTDSISIWGTDCRIARDAANTLALRNGAAAQTFNVYNTFTDASNYERGYFRYVSNQLEIGHDAAGTGTAARVVLIRSQGNLVLRGNVRFANTGGTENWRVDTNLFPITSNAVDLGTSSARVRSAFFGTSTVNAGYHEMAEMTAPAAPATNGVRIYAEDDGAGKTRLMALFATGAAQQIAIEP